MDPITITSDLINLPSFKREVMVGQYIYDYLQQYKYLDVTKQPVSRGRFNVVAQAPGAPELMLAGHMDTVVPKKGSQRDPAKATLEVDKLYGLGSYDMKSGIAAILSSLNQINDIRGLVLLFYCDEEYGFLGMRKFIASNSLPSKPKLALIAEPSELQIWNAHRGLIEVSFAVTGISGHAANPACGINAIDGLQKVLDQLKPWLQTYSSPSLGSTSLNVAYFRGGLYQTQNGNALTLGKDGNNIADYAEAVIDIRPSVTELRAEVVIKQLKKLIDSAGLKLASLQTNHDLGALYTNPAELKALEQIAGSSYLDAPSAGYGDGQLIQEAWNIPVAYLGPKGGNAHAPNEWVDIKSIQTLTDMYARIIQAYCTT